MNDTQHKYIHVCEKKTFCRQNIKYILSRESRGEAYLSIKCNLNKILHEMNCQQLNHIEHLNVEGVNVLHLLYDVFRNHQKKLLLSNDMY
jgi:hypothetical protein